MATKLTLFKPLFKPLPRFTTSSPLTKMYRKMSFYRNNDNYSQGDKFAWEVGQEAIGIKPLNDVGTLRQTPYHFAKLNKTRQYGLSGDKVGNFGSKVEFKGQNFQQEVDKLMTKKDEIRLPKQLIHSTSPAHSYCVHGYEYRESFPGRENFVFIPKSTPEFLSKQLARLSSQ